jgi:hypothetical protein
MIAYQYKGISRLLKAIMYAGLMTRMRISQRPPHHHQLPCQHALSPVTCLNKRCQMSSSINAEECAILDDDACKDFRTIKHPA